MRKMQCVDDENMKKKPSSQDWYFYEDHWFGSSVLALGLREMFGVAKIELRKLYHWQPSSTLPQASMQLILQDLRRGELRNRQILLSFQTSQPEPSII